MQISEDPQVSSKKRVSLKIHNTCNGKKDIVALRLVKDSSTWQQDRAALVQIVNEGNVARLWFRGDGMKDRWIKIC